MGAQDAGAGGGTYLAWAQVVLTGIGHGVACTEDG